MKNYIYNFKNKFFCSVCIIILLAFNLLALSHVADLCIALMFNYEVKPLWIVLSVINLVINIIFICLVVKKIQASSIFAIIYYVATCVIAVSLIGISLTALFIISSIIMLKNRKPIRLPDPVQSKVSFAENNLNKPSPIATPISTVDRPTVNSTPVYETSQNVTINSTISAYNTFAKNINSDIAISSSSVFKALIEAKALFSFLHYLETRDEQYAPINVEEYEKAFIVNDEEKSLFNQRLCDYFEIDLNGIVLPYEQLLSNHKQHGSCEKHSQYFYAFAMFLASDHIYSKLLDVAQLSKSTEATFENLASVYCAKIAYEEAQKAYNTL